MQIHNTIMQFKLITPEENNTSRQGGEENENTSTLKTVGSEVQNTIQYR